MIARDDTLSLRLAQPDGTSGWCTKPELLAAGFHALNVAL